MSKIAILYIGIGKYCCFWKSFYISIERFFLPNTPKHYFVFTDQENIYAQNTEKVHVIRQADLGWPKNTLYRFAFFDSIKYQLIKYEFIFFMNANVYCNQIVNEEEVLTEKEDYLFVMHHAFVGKDINIYPYERRKESLAYIPYGCGKHYITGGVNGGKANSFIKMCGMLHQWIDEDYLKGIIPIWHDESMINKYALLNTNYKLLSLEYFYPELVGNIALKGERKIVARDKRKYFEVGDLKKDESLKLKSGEKQLMNEHYTRICFKWMLLYANNISCMEVLGTYNKLAIYGMRNLREILISDIEKEEKGGIIDCILNVEPQKYKGNYIAVKPEEYKGTSDVIVVTETYDYEVILAQLMQITNTPIVSLEDIINELLCKYKIEIKSYE